MDILWRPRKKRSFPQINAKVKTLVLPHNVSLLRLLRFLRQFQKAYRRHRSTPKRVLMDS